ncbi:MAG: hypothetical protein LUQ20_00655 [Candidatus Methanoperedens sp.]|nr:hypothetical protein [Candidatus Methanoperedens sp.]
MNKVGQNGRRKTLYIRLNVYPCGNADPTKNLTISCPDRETRFKTTLSDNGLRKFREQILKFYKAQILEKRSSMLVTHGGKAKKFRWEFQGDQITITNEDGRTHLYSAVETYATIDWLSHRFDDRWFPLANNVKKLGNRSEVDGLGVAILHQRPIDITHAQGASYLVGVVLEKVEILEWNGKSRGIEWRIIHRPSNVSELRRIVNTNVALQSIKWRD